MYSSNIREKYCLHLCFESRVKGLCVKAPPIKLNSIMITLLYQFIKSFLRNARVKSRIYFIMIFILNQSTFSQIRTHDITHILCLKVQNIHALKNSLLFFIPLLITIIPRIKLITFF